jgi:hypothetical protein
VQWFFVSLSLSLSLSLFLCFFAVLFQRMSHGLYCLRRACML